MEENPPPDSDDYNIASYFFALRTQTVSHAVTEAPNELMETRKRRSMLEANKVMLSVSDMGATPRMICEPTQRCGMQWRTV
jgi:hypothetical protein